MADELGLWQIAKTHPDRLAVVSPDGRETSYAELAATTNRYAHGLRSLGLSTGDSVALLLPNGVELLALYFAALQSGLYLVPINWHLVGPEVAYILGDSEAKVFVAHERFAEAATEAVTEVGLPEEHRFAVGAIGGFQALDELAECQPDTLPEDRTAGAPMQYTSGTTGRPKGVRRPLTGAAPESVAERTALFFSLFGMQPFDDNVHICGSPMYHTAVLVWASTSVQVGHPAVLMDRWGPREMLELVDRYRVTQSHMVPTQFNRLLSLPEDERKQYDLSSLRYMVHGAAPCPKEVKRAMIEWWGPVVIDYYAATEGGGTLITSEEWLRKPGSVGRAWPGSEIKIFDDDRNELAPDEVGTVYMKMATSDFSYKGDPGKTRDNRIGDFFTVGDVGYLDEDGYLFLCDRKSDMIISGGVNIYPAEIEAELCVHPKVDDVAVFGIPHPDWGEEIKAVVQPVAGVEPGDALTEELLEYAAGRLAKFKRPKSVDYVEEMPRDPNGKLYKRKLRDPYWAEQETAI
ncbi:MAG TPA: acyl-CoA synthetase [Nocardioidaceae bacterium]|nr:acyl-CoA synthetase [Nocardioidaceae bacterium]